MRDQSQNIKYPSPTDKVAIGAMFSLTPTTSHDHSGSSMNGGQISYKVLLDKPVDVSTTKLIATQIQLLHTTPVILVPAQGAHTVTIVTSVVAKIKYMGTAYTGGNNLEFRYTNASGIKVTADLANTFINSTSDTYAAVSGITTAFTPVLNSPITVSVPTANPAAGNSTITFVVTYYVTTLP